MNRRLVLALIVLLLCGGISEAAKRGGPATQAFGVNLSGPEFAPWVGQSFPTTANWNSLQNYGIPKVRLPIAWESIQPTLGAALDTTYLNSVKAALASAASRRIQVIVDLHNFGSYCDQAHWVSSGCGYAGNAGVPAAGVTFLGAAGGPTTANYVDVWTRIATALNGLPGLGGYNLMNEPVDISIGRTNLLFAPNGFGDGVSVAPWALGNSATITQQAPGTNPLGAAYGPAWTLNSGTGFGSLNQSVTLTAVPHTVSCYGKVNTGSATLLYYMDGPFDVAAISTTWARLTPFTWTPSAGAHVLSISEGAGTAGQDISIANCQVEIGSSATAYVPNPLLVYYQAAITAIRSISSLPIYVDGLAGSTPYQWPWVNWELAQLTGGSLVFSAHAYFCTTAAQGGGGGTCAFDFSGYAGLTVTSGVDFAAPFVNWLTTTGTRGFFGEFGTTSACCVASPTDANASWLTLQNNFLAYLTANNIGGAVWFYSDVFPSDKFNMTNGDARLPAMLATGLGH